MNPSGGFTAPTIGGNANNIGQDLNSMAPLATSWGGPSVGVPGEQIVRNSGTSTANASGSFLPAFWNFAKSAVSEGADIVSKTPGWIANQFENTAKGIYNGVGSSEKYLVFDQQQGNNLNQQTQELSTRLDSIIQTYKSGGMTKQAYLQALNQWNQDNANVSSKLSALESKSNTDQQNATKGLVSFGVTMASLMTDGMFGAIGGKLGAGLGASDAISGGASREAATYLSNASELVKGAQVIEKLAADKGAWDVVSPLAQQAMRQATSEVLQAAGTKATAAQISRAVAADVLLKYPLYYNAMSGTGVQVYNELNQNKYGDAAKTAAFNALLLFSGGPIGWGLKNAGKVADDLAVAMGLKTGSVLDLLSSRIDGKDPLALGKIAQEQIQKGNAADVKSMIVALASNVKRAGGNGEMAVNFITDHLSNYIGWGDLKNMTHQEVWDNMLNYWKHAEGLNELKNMGEIKGISANDARSIVPGRFSAADRNAIASYVSGGKYTTEERLQLWQQFKQDNPNAAYANNVNLDKQVTNLIKSSKDGKTLGDAINNIDALVGLEGIPKDYAKQMAKDGYIAIIPTDHNMPVVPFEQTSGKLVTNGATGDFFQKAAQPVPVLQSVGVVLTGMGLSPVAAGQSVQSAFEQNFSKAAGAFGFNAEGVDGEKSVLQKISDYMKDPAAHGAPSIAGKSLPMSDMRQLGTKDIMRATGLSQSDAQAVGNAIMQAHLDVPVEVAGLGGKLLDWNMKLNPLAGRYSRLQGALRFSWNPVFTQARLPLKEEFLSQMQTGGKMPTVAGTNWFMRIFFPGQYKQLDNIINAKEFTQLVEGHGLNAEASGASTGFSDLGATEKLSKSTKYPIAGLVQSMARNANMDATSFMQQHPQEVQDAVTALLHYDKNNSFLNSPMAKTLNMAIFPFRFNVKVGTFLAKFMASQPPGIQYAAIKGIMDVKPFLQSPQGQAWYSQHSDVIGLFKYFSPLETISTISNALQLKHDSIAQYGELGGLPFGWIPQATDAVGLTHFGQAYVNPKTGVIAKDYVPTSAYGMANVAIQDFLGSLFTYPGAAVGLPSKGTFTRGAANNILPYSSKQFNAVEPSNVTPQEQQFSQIVQQTHGIAPPPIQNNTPQNATLNPVPAQHSPLQTPVPKSTSGTKLRKSQFKPAPLP